MAKDKSACLLFVEDRKAGISTQTLEAVEKAVGDSRAEHLYLIIESRGGDPFSAVPIMNILNTHFDKISTIVPKYAKSAATLMSLGTNEIYMQERSALGPLDLPIEHPKDGSRISALDVVNATTAMATLADSIAKDKYKFFRDRNISTIEAAKLAMENATEFLKPIVEQIDPYHLQKAQRELRIGRWYAIDMLLARMMNNFDTAAETARVLVHSFPAHEYSIYSEEAKSMLNLNVRDLSTLSIWNSNLKARYDAVCNRNYHVEYAIIEPYVGELKKEGEGKPRTEHAQASA